MKLVWPQKHIFNAFACHTIAILIVFLAQNNLASAKTYETYHDKEKHFSFSLSKEWHLFHREKILTYSKELFETLPSKIIFYGNKQKINNEKPENTFLLIYYKPYKNKLSDIALDSFFQAENEQDRIRESISKKATRLRTEKYFPKSWKTSKTTKVDFKYNKSEHCSFETIQMQNQKQKNMNIITNRMLGNSWAIIFDLYTENANLHEDLEEMESIVDSFIFDSGYGFGEKQKGFFSSHINDPVIFVSIGLIFIFITLSIVFCYKLTNNKMPNDHLDHLFKKGTAVVSIVLGPTMFFRCYLDFGPSGNIIFAFAVFSIIGAIIPWTTYSFIVFVIIPLIFKQR